MKILSVVDGELRPVPLPRVTPGDWGGEIITPGDHGHPVMRADDEAVVLGRSAYHAALLDGREPVGYLVECDDSEIEVLQTAEAAGTAHLATAVQRLLHAPVRKGERGRPRTVGWAYALVAAVRGVTAETVCTLMSRQKSSGIKIDMLGLPDDPAWSKAILDVKRHLLDADTRLQQAQSSLTRAAATGEAPEAKLERFRDRVKAIRSELRLLVPESVCPACKGLDGYTQACATCLGSGWVGPLEPGALPDELYARDALRVLDNGKVVEVDPLDYVDLGLT